MATEQDKKSDDFIPVSQILNAKPRLGPIPGEHVVAWAVIIVLSYLICQGLFGMPWTTTVLVSAWGMGTWWALNGDESWRFLSKFFGVPRWTFGNHPYISLLENWTSRSSRQKAKRATQPSKRSSKSPQRRTQKTRRARSR